MKKGYKRYDVSIKGTSPLLMHNGKLSDPLNPVAKAMKEISKKRKKLDADFQKMSDLEFRGGLYLDSIGQIIVPTIVLEAMLVEGAKVSREGQVALSSLFVDEMLEFDYDGPKEVEERIKDPAYRLVTGVKVQRNRVERCRPKFDNWKLKFRVSVLEDNVPKEMLARWVEAAGISKGLGDWRPRFGRYDLVKVEEVAQQFEKAA